MIESTTKHTALDFYSDINKNKLWVSTDRNNYSEVLNVFFPDGVKFNGDLLLYKNIGRYTGDIPTGLGIRTNLLNVPLKINLHLQSSTSFGIKLYLGPESIYYGTFDIDIDLETITFTNDGEAFTINDYSFDFTTNTFICEFVIEDDSDEIHLTLENFTALDFIVTESYLVRDDNLLFLPEDHDTIPQFDSIDLCAFLWAAGKGIVLPNVRIFDSKQLIENKFEEIDNVEIMSYKTESLTDDKLNEILETTNTGDFYIFNQDDLYHAIFIIDIDKKLYTEVSSKVENELGYFYNAKLNPYNFERRIKELSENSIFYKIRLN